MPAVNPDILIWARETAGLDLNEAAKKLGFQDSKTRSAADKLNRLEVGEKHPTRNQLYRMSVAYHQPLLVFHLTEPPKKDDRGEDFRTLPERTQDRKGNARLNLLMRDVKAAQNLVKRLLEEEGHEPLWFVNSASLSQSVAVVAQDIVETLNFELQTFREQGSVRDAFAYLRERIEGSGIFVLLKSDLGSHHTTIPVDVFRGFVFADPLAPFIVINRQDAAVAWSFTSLHETVHLWLGQSGVSGIWGQSQIEVFCNRVAGEILLPPVELLGADFRFEASTDAIVDQIKSFADARNISLGMVTYGLKLQDRISESQWQILQNKIAKVAIQQKESTRAKQRSQGGGPTFYVVRRHQLGSALVGLAKQFLDSGQLTPSKAGVVLGVKPINVYPLLNPDYFKARN